LEKQVEELKMNNVEGELFISTLEHVNTELTLKKEAF